MPVLIQYKDVFKFLTYKHVQASKFLNKQQFNNMCRHYPQVYLLKVSAVW